MTMQLTGRITPDTLMTLEAYAKWRKLHQQEVIAHRKLRSVQLGDHINVQFESELTMRYQIQEMLRIERIFEEDGIQGEIDAYDPLVPDGTNFKATMLIEYDDVDARRVALSKLVGIEDRTFVQVAGFDRVHAIADEDLERDTDDKTAAVHFVRFELAPGMIAALKDGADLGVGVDHPEYRASIAALPAAVRDALAADLA